MGLKINKYIGGLKNEHQNKKNICKINFNFFAIQMKCNNALFRSWLVVYFDQHLSDVHPKHWLKYAFLMCMYVVFRLPILLLLVKRRVTPFLER